MTCFKDADEPGQFAAYLETLRPGDDGHEEPRDPRFTVLSISERIVVARSHHRLR